MKLTREQAVELVGEWWVGKVESLACEPTDRVYLHESGEIEWSAELKIDDYEYFTEEQIKKLPVGGCTLAALYYTSGEEAAMAKNNGGYWFFHDWTPDHYEIS